MKRATQALLAVVATVYAAACGDPGGSALPASPASDAVYVAAMGDLLKLDREMRSRPRPPLPAPDIGRLSSDTSWKIQRRADSLRQVASDSAGRAAVLRRHKVTEAELEATAIVLTTNPKRAREVWEAITKRAQTPAQGNATP